MKKYAGPSCTHCGVKSCYRSESGKRPDICPMPVEKDLYEEIERECLENEKIRKMLHASAQTEAGGYGRLTRIEEIADFARRMGVKKLGIATCIGLLKEARVVQEIFVAHGFEVFSICCKTGSLSKEKIGIQDGEKVKPGRFEATCNPVAQAALLARAGTELNVVVGLCVGHDSLFFMHSKAPATVLITKDRVLGHNPVACINTAHQYYKRLLEKG